MTATPALAFKSLMEQAQERQSVVLPPRIVAPMTHYSHNPRQLAGLNRGGRAKGSRNRIYDEIGQAARQYGPEALACIVTVMRAAMKARDGIDAPVVLRCADLLLCRGYGTPPASVALTGADGGPVSFRSFDDDQLDQFIERLESTVLIEGEVVAPSEGGSGTASEDALRPPAVA